MNKIYIICREEQQKRISERFTLLCSELLKKFDDVKDTEIAYVVGTVTPEMVGKIEKLEKAGVRMVKVNDNLINEDLYEKVLQGKVKVRDREKWKKIVTSSTIDKTE